MPCAAASDRVKAPSRLGCRVAAALLFLAGAPVLAEGAQRCEVTIGVTGSTSLGGLELLVEYDGADGQFAGNGEDVECVALGQGAYSSARHDPAADELALGMISAVGVELPQDLWRCAFDAASAVTAGDFQVAVLDSIDPLAVPVAASAGVSSVTCDAQAVCGNGVVEGGEECDSGGPGIACTGGCKLTRGSQRCEIGFRVTGPGPVGGVQFRVNYGAVAGEFEGTGTAVRCTEALESALVAVEDRDAEDELRLAMISATGVALPVDLWRCVFVTNAAPLQLEAFAFSNVIATDDELASVPVNVTAITGDCIYGPYCGDGNVDPQEACDDGNRIATDACTNACAVAACGDGITRTGVEQCDDGNSTAGDCCSSNCLFEPGTTVCRASAGICDAAENCTGTSGVCPADTKKTTLCRPSAGVCDVAEVCDGASSTCPANVLGTGVCRAATGVCDLAETCSGSSTNCPVDAFQPGGTACTSDGNVCTDDVCNSSGACTHPGNDDPCNDGLYCNGSDSCAGGTCSVHVGSPCTGADGDGDCKESCSETNDNCKGNDPDGSVCNDGNSSTQNDQCLSGLCVAGTGNTECGDADDNGTVQASDALRILRKAVGQDVSCPLFRCDTDDNGLVQTSDALRVLRKAVAQPVILDCPAP